MLRIPTFRANRNLTKKNYVEALRALIHGKLRKNLCRCCVLASGMASIGEDMLFLSPSRCRRCRDFVDLPATYKEDGPECPCVELGRDEARKRATLALERWDEGTHKWQKGGK